MGYQHSFHAGIGSSDFLGLRRTRRGGMEIVYDDGAARRIIWRVACDPSLQTEGRVSEALRVAVGAANVLPSLYNELNKRALQIERVGERV